MKLTKKQVENFWKKVRVGGINDCWEWTGCVGGNPVLYGKLTINNKSHKAHRVSWVIHFGDIPEGMKILHRCDNGRCVNPNHLWVGTQNQNIQDMKQKGRSAPMAGSQNGNAKLSEGDVAVIRKLLAGGATQISISRDYGVSKSTIWWIANGSTWKVG